MQDPPENSNQTVQNLQGLLLCPYDYQQVLQERLRAFAKIQSKIKKANLTADQEK